MLRMAARIAPAMVRIVLLISLVYRSFRVNFDDALGSFFVQGDLHVAGKSRLKGGCGQDCPAPQRLLTV
jgi:hypothetical protein